MKKTFVGFHGDIDWFKIDRLPKGAAFVGEFTSHITQEGETTGHMHRVKSAAKFEVYKVKDKTENDGIVERWIYLLKAPAEVSHEEHRTHVMEPGIYYIDQENEESAQDGLIHRVVD
jgi:hypothetical protein